MRRLPWLTITELVGVLCVVIVTVWSMHPSLIFSTTLITGGDTGSHVAAAAFLRSQGILHLTPWYPGWFDGMPLYTYYFVLPDLIAVLLSYVIPFTVAFKVMTVLGSVLMPLAAYCMGRLLRAPRPIPVALAMATLPFLFDASFTIDGGNLFSTMAGEYAFSLSLALAMLAIGLFARGMRTGRGYWLAALCLAGTLLSHLLPWLFALVIIGVVALFELAARRGIGDPRQTRDRSDFARPVRFAVGAGLLSLALTAWWFLPFASLQSLTNSMGYTNDDVSSTHAIFSILGWFTSSGVAAGDRWVIVLAAIGFVLAWWSRELVGMVLATWTALSLVAFIFDPQSAIWNERLVPFWFLGIHLLAGWLVGYGGLLVIRRGARLRERHVALLLEAGEEGYFVTGDPSASGPSEHTASAQWLAREQHRSYFATISAIITLGLASVVPGLIPNWASALHLNTSGNEVTYWAAFNYSGYQSQPAWPEYHDLMTTMARTAKEYGCGRAMWEYSADEQRFGTPMALMLLPYWTNNCVDSMEGLFFESSATTPYHFLDQAELSTAPSDPQVGLTYGVLNVRLGVEHLQMLGVKYYIAFSPSAIAQANADPALRLVAQTKAWPTPGVQWKIYLISNSSMVTPLPYAPTVVSGISSREAWLNANEPWWLVSSRWSRPLAMTGPASWPHSSSPTTLPPASREPSTTVSNIKVGAQSLSFDVSRTGVPVEVKMSYFPRWHVSGGSGPYRISPNLMAVVPTSHHVVLTYTTTPAQTWGDYLTEGTVVVGGVVGVGAWRKRQKRRKWQG